MDIQTLKDRKKELKLTNEQLAELSGIALGAINKIFSGATKSPQFDTLCALVEVLGLSMFTA